MPVKPYKLTVNGMFHKKERLNSKSLFFSSAFQGIGDGVRKEKNK